MNNRESADAFIKSWNAGRQEFVLRTSGSTGLPKDIVLYRKWMEWSASRTAGFMHPGGADSILCCLPVSKVGGLMMLVRSLEWGIPLEVAEPSANPLLQKSGASIISLTPFQLYHVMQHTGSLENLKRFREVLIGGGEISPVLEKDIRDLKTSTIFRHSYGMTETYSHIALRALNGEHASAWMKPFRDVTVTADPSGSAIIQTPFEPGGFMTNDLIQSRQDGSFMVTGRKDFIINSGGVKLQPELIEQKIYEMTDIRTPFAISSKADPVLGHKLVLVTENREVFEKYDLGFLKELSPYAIPKEIMELNPLPQNEGGKTDRLKIRELINR